MEGEAIKRCEAGLCPHILFWRIFGSHVEDALEKMSSLRLFKVLSDRNSLSSWGICGESRGDVTMSTIAQRHLVKIRTTLCAWVPVLSCCPFGFRLFLVIPCASVYLQPLCESPVSKREDVNSSQL